MPRAELDLLQGTLDVLVLKALSWGARHGHAVATWIRATTDDDLNIEDGALYTALHGLEKRGLVEAEWGLSENNRKAKDSELAAPGRGARRRGGASCARKRSAGPATRTPSSGCSTPPGIRRWRGSAWRSPGSGGSSGWWSGLRRSSRRSTRRSPSTWPPKSGRWWRAAWSGARPGRRRGGGSAGWIRPARSSRASIGGDG